MATSVESSPVTPEDVSPVYDSVSDDLDSPMDTETEAESEMKTSTSLQMMLASIAEERSREHKIVSDEGGFVVVARNEFWTSLFIRYFLDQPEDVNRDDMLFYVRKSTAHSRFNIPQTEIEVYRKSSKNQPQIDDASVDWEETVYLNLILQHFEYQVTCAVCSRTGNKELQILKKFSQKVYASPSRRRMDSKGTEEEMTYPNIFFTVDNFEEAFCDVIVRDSEMVLVELVAHDRRGIFQGVIFLGSIRYDSLKHVYDTRASLTHRMAQQMNLGWFKGHKRVEFVRMRGPQGKGHAEMAISRVKGSGPETPLQTPSTENFPIDDFDNREQPNPFSQRRMSDPNTSWNHLLRGSLRKNGMRKSRSETENVDAYGVNGCTEVEAESIHDEFDESGAHYNGFFGRSFGQAWGWFKERKRASSVALHSYLTYVTLPWHRIVADVCGETECVSSPVLTAYPFDSFPSTITSSPITPPDHPPPPGHLDPPPPGHQPQQQDTLVVGGDHSSPYSYHDYSNQYCC